MSWKGLKSSGLVSYRSVNSISLKIILVYHLEILNKPFLFEIFQKSTQFMALGTFEWNFWTVENALKRWAGDNLSLKERVIIDKDAKVL